MSLKPLVSSTEKNAVPIEAATCWVMFISVEPRAISWFFSVCSAAVMIGIIVPPMPRPMTNSAASRKRYDGDVGREGDRDAATSEAPTPTWVNMRHADHDHAMPVITILPGPIRSVSTPATAW